MNIWSFVFSIAIVTALVFGVSAIVPDPVDVGRGERITLQAQAEAEAARLKNEKTAALNMIEIAAENSTTAERVAVQKEQVRFDAKIARAAKTIGLVSFCALAVSLAVLALGLSTATARRAHFLATAVYPNRDLQLPVRQYKLLSTDGHRRAFIFDYARGGVTRLDVERESDAARIAALTELQNTVLMTRAVKKINNRRHVDIMRPK